MAMGSRFVLIIALARLLEPKEIGIFGLFMSTVAFSMLVVGGEFYAYSQRELMSSPKSHWSFILQHQLIAIGLIYLIVLPPQLLIFTFDLLPQSFLFWFIAILLVEHLGQEINRLLVAMQHPILASWILFIRMGTWVIYVVPLMWLYPENRELEIVFSAWFVGALIAVVIGGFVIYREISPWTFYEIDWVWIKKGFKIAALFFIATICFKALTTTDRYIVEILNNLDILGVYVLYIGIAMSVVTFLDTAVFSFLYPRAVTLFKKGEISLYDYVMKEMALSAIAVTLILVTIIAVLSPYIFDWIGKVIYLEYISLLWMLLLVSSVYGLSLIPHYGLYAVGGDKCMVFSHISSMVVFFTIVFLTKEYSSIQATTYGLLAAFLLIGAVKSYCYYQIYNKRNIRKNLIINDKNVSDI